MEKKLASKRDTSPEPLPIHPLEDRSHQRKAISPEWMDTKTARSLAEEARAIYCQTHELEIAQFKPERVSFEPDPLQPDLLIWTFYYESTTHPRNSFSICVHTNGETVIAR